jgi:hypothetical protein
MSTHNPQSRLYSPPDFSSPGSASRSFTTVTSTIRANEDTPTSLDKLTEERLNMAIQNALEHYMYHSAIFLAERLYSFCPNDENLILVATCYYRNKELPRAYELLKLRSNVVLTGPLDLTSSLEVSVDKTYYPKGFIYMSS